MILDRRAALLGSLALALPGAARAADPLEARGWKHLTFRGRTPTRFRAGEGDAIEVEARSSSSILYRALSVDPAATPRLAWRWRLDAGVPPTDLSRKGGDDRSLAILVGFAFDAGRASPRARARHRFETMMAGSEPPGAVLFYLLGGDRPSGAVVSSPYRCDNFLIAMPPPPPGRWAEAGADVAADYRRLLSAPPTRIVQLGIAADSDDTRSVARGAVDAFRWLPA